MSETEAEAVAELAAQSKRTSYTVERVTHPDGTEATVLVTHADGFDVETCDLSGFFDENRKRPRRRKGVARLTDLASFVHHIKRFGDTDSLVFADRKPTAPSMTCVLDYHHAGASAEPRFGEHRAVYAFPLSDEWTAWTAQNSKGMSQLDFAQFLEDRLCDVANPENAGDSAKAFASLLSCNFASPSRLLELSRGLSVHVGARIQQHGNLSTGEGQVSFAEEHSDQAGKPLRIPGAFLIALPVFRNGPLYQVAARLRYRVSAGTITWSYDLYRVSAVLDHAIDEACKTVSQDTGLPVLAGTPEVA